MYKLISYYIHKINPVTAANGFFNPLVRTSEATSDTDLFDMIILKLLENVNFLDFEFYHNFIVNIDFFIMLLYILVRKGYFLGIGPGCEYLFYLCVSERCRLAPAISDTFFI